MLFHSLHKLPGEHEKKRESKGASFHWNVVGKKLSLIDGWFESTTN
jgi:hypothetical protein